MAHNPRVFIFIIYRNAQIRDDFTHGVDNLVVAFFLDMAIVRFDDFVTTLSKAADNRPALFAADGKLHFIAVIPGICGTERRFDKNILLAADARDGIDDLLTLRLELGHVA